MEDFVLCGNPCPFPNRWEPCPKVKDHTDEHAYWSQTARSGAKSGRNGIWIADEGGEILAHVSFEGAANAEDICALLALQEVVAARMRDDPPEPRGGFIPPP